MTLPVLEYNSPGVQKPRPLISLLEKFALIAIGAMLPMVCFGISTAIKYPLEPEWQSGDWHRYIGFIPDGRAGFPFFPLLLYSMVCLCVFVFKPNTSRLLIVRLGLYTGVVLALQYTCIQSLLFDHYFPVAIGVGLASNFIVLGILKGLERMPRRALIWSGIGLAIVALLSAVVPYGRRGELPLEALGATGIAALLFAPAWCCGVYVRTSLLAIRLNRKPDEAGVHFTTFLAWIPWLGGYAVAWKWSITNAIILYSKLPKSVPGCYIATAAASGHRGFVGSKLARAADGSTFPANQQLRRLKCVEIAMATVCPTGHRVSRLVYDRIGPPLARVIALHPLAGDLAFVLLKPLEWLTFGVLMIVVPDVRSKISCVYAG